jgi:hypothetical protein
MEIGGFGLISQPETPFLVFWTPLKYTSHEEYFPAHRYLLFDWI